MGCWDITTWSTAKDRSSEKDRIRVIWNHTKRRWIDYFQQRTHCDVLMRRDRALHSLRWSVILVLLIWGLVADFWFQGLLIDSGSRQLVAVFTRWEKETSSSVDAGALVEAGSSIAQDFLLSLIATTTEQESPSRRSPASSSTLRFLSSCISARCPISVRKSSRISNRDTQMSELCTWRRVCDSVRRISWSMRCLSRSLVNGED